MRLVDRAARVRTTPVESTLRWLAWFSAADLILLGYLLVMLLVVHTSGAGEALARSTRRLETLLVVLVGTCAFGRARSRLPGAVSSAGYRVAVVAVLLSTYLMLKDLLPAVRAGDVDATLLASDVRLLGFEPTLALEHLTTPPVVEWFSFFYFSYFVICGLFAAAFVAMRRAPRASAEFAIGCALVYGLGQLGYVAVPAYGPIRHLSSTFAHPLSGGFFYRCVLETVSRGSAMKDVFPSLHTAVPVWLALFAARRATESRTRTWRGVALVASFFAANIVASTIVLRWHWAVDVIAGLALAVFARWAAPRLARLEARSRARAGLRDAWRFGADGVAQPDAAS